MRDDARSGASAKRRTSWTNVALMFGCVSLALLHGLFCWKMVGGWAGLMGPWPFLYDDHSFQYYYAVTASDYLRQSGTTAGYDPFFMSGYAKTILFPSSSTLAEWLVFLASPFSPAVVYKWYVFIAAAAWPWLMWAASRLWRPHPTPTAPGSPVAGTNLAVVFLGEAYFLTSVPGNYVLTGMVTFCLSAPLTLCAGGLLCRAWEQGRAGWWLAAAVAIAFCVLVHACSAVAMFAPFLIALASGSWRRRAILIAIAAATFVVNAHWIVPGWLLRSTLGTTATGIGFINPNVIERLGEFAGQAPWIETFLLFAAIGGLWTWPRSLTIPWRLLVAALLSTFFLGYLAGWFRSLDFLQPGRYTLYFFTWSTIPAANAVVRMIAGSGGRAIRAASVGLVMLTAGMIALLWQMELRSLADWRAFLHRPSALAHVPKIHEALLGQLRRLVQPGHRVLFEERNRGITNDVGEKLPDRIGHYRVAPLIPLWTGASVIGGPYLYTHLETNFSQFGDGRLFGKASWKIEDFRRYVELYDLEWIVVWSPAWRQFVQNHPEAFETEVVIDRFYCVAKIRRSPEQNSVRVGKAFVQARTGLLRIRRRELRNGRVVLPFHWTPRLRTEPPCEIAPLWLLDDPVPFIELVDPPNEVRIWLDPW